MLTSRFCNGARTAPRAQSREVSWVGCVAPGTERVTDLSFLKTISGGDVAAGARGCFCVDPRHPPKHLARPHAIEARRAVPRRERRRLGRLAVAAAPQHALARRSRAPLAPDRGRAARMSGDARRLPARHLALLLEPDRSRAPVLPHPDAVDPGARRGREARG